jgi:uncharacterized protein with HEPN domain
MSRRDDTVPMRHMLDYAREVIAMIHDRTRQDSRDPVAEDRAPGTESFHGYNAVDYGVVWDIATIEIPVLVAALERALPGHVS